MGKVVYLIIGIIFLLGALLLYFSVKMPWTALVALILAVVCFIGAFGSKKQPKMPEEPK